MLNEGQRPTTLLNCNTPQSKNKRLGVVYSFHLWARSSHAKLVKHGKQHSQQRKKEGFEEEIHMFVEQ